MVCLIVSSITDHSRHILISGLSPVQTSGWLLFCTDSDSKTSCLEALSWHFHAIQLNDHLGQVGTLHNGSRKTVLQISAPFSFPLLVCYLVCPSSFLPREPPFLPKLWNLIDKGVICVVGLGHLFQGTYFGLCPVTKMLGPPPQMNEPLSVRDSRWNFVGPL